MSNPLKGRTVHVLIPYTTEVACGQPGHAANAIFREHVNCRNCKKTGLYKDLPSAPKKWAQDKGLRK